MCGLFAALSLAGPIREDYAPSLAMIAHRGPDGADSRIVSLEGGDEGYRRGRAWLGHRRLSIIDPDPRGNQPMATADDRFVLVYNGEIYNYLELREECRAAGLPFRTGTDTEVLLAAWSLWGERTLERVIGMFAFVLVDRQEGVAWLARDAFGIKPLHYAITADRLLVCSEIAPILATGAVEIDIDPTQSFEYLRFGASANPDQTPVAAVRRLPAASVARFNFHSGTLAAPRQFWAPTRNTRNVSFADAVVECRERFLANLRLHLRSDVPVGAALSGGLDSSAIVCGLNHIEPDLRLNTFSFISANPRLSEERWVDAVNTHVGAIPHKIKPQPEDLASDLEALVRAQGEPFGTSSIYAQYRVFKAAREAGVPVTLDGQGADEMLGGYYPYVGTAGAAYLRRGRPDKAAALAMRGGHTNGVRLALLAQIAQACLSGPAQRRFRGMIGREVFPAFLDRDWFESSRASWQDAADATIGTYEGLQAHLADSLSGTSLPTLLRIADRSSMASSIESRVPFLTPDFADFLLELPSEYIISANGDRKHVFREAMRGILPEAVRTRRDKIGFVADDALWLRRNWGVFETYLDEIAEAPQFDTDRTIAYLNAFKSGGKASAQQVWRIFIFAVWRRQTFALGDSVAQARPLEIASRASA